MKVEIVHKKYNWPFVDVMLDDKSILCSLSLGTTIKGPKALKDWVSLLSNPQYDTMEKLDMVEQLLKLFIAEARIGRY